MVDNIKITGTDAGSQECQKAYIQLRIQVGFFEIKHSTLTNRAMNGGWAIPSIKRYLFVFREIQSSETNSLAGTDRRESAVSDGQRRICHLQRAE